MINVITGKFLKLQSFGLPRFAASHIKDSKTKKTHDIANEHLAKEKLAKLSFFVEKLASPQAPMVPYFEQLPKVYRELAAAEVSKEQGVAPEETSPRGGMYSLTMEVDKNLFSSLRESDVSIIELEKEGRAMYRKKLVYVAERVVISCHSCYHLADVQYLMYLVEHIDALPRVMKNGKGNIFAGTTISIGEEHYVPMATFLNGTFNIELVPLTSELADVAQFVIIERNR